MNIKNRGYIMMALVFFFTAAWAQAADKNSMLFDEKRTEILKNATYVGSEDCASCHDKAVKEFKLSPHARISLKDAEVKDCEMCHGPASAHIDAGGGKGSIINPKKDPTACFGCHTDKKLQFRLPYHHPVLEGKMSCTDCHSAHGEEVRPWSGTTLDGVNEACAKCHKDQTAPFVWGHEALKEGCNTCHQVHGSIHDKMLLSRGKNVCIRCHTQTNFPTMGKVSGHGTSYMVGGASCFAAGCHTAVHGSNFDDHLRY